MELETGSKIKNKTWGSRVEFESSSVSEGLGTLDTKAILSLYLPIYLC